MSHHHADRLNGEGPGGSLWGVLDCARDPSLVGEVRCHSAEFACLFERAAPEVEAAAPWLVRLAEGSRLLDRWRTEGLAADWGILFRSEETIHVLRRDFRKKLLVTLPGKKPAIFRFYDPRVMQDGGPELAAEFPAIRLVG